MNNFKPIITRFTVEYFERKTDPIFSSEDIYDLKKFIRFPSDAEIDSLCINNKFIINDKVYLIKENFCQQAHPMHARQNSQQ
jgi:hypothetical protein